MGLSGLFGFDVSVVSLRTSLSILPCKALAVAFKACSLSAFDLGLLLLELAGTGCGCVQASCTEIRRIILVT